MVKYGKKGEYTGAQLQSHMHSAANTLSISEDEKIVDEVSGSSVAHVHHRMQLNGPSVCDTVIERQVEVQNIVVRLREDRGQAYSNCQGGILVGLKPSQTMFSLRMVIEAPVRWVKLGLLSVKLYPDLSGTPIRRDHSDRFRELRG